MRHRSYFVRMPTDAATMPYLDIFMGGQSVGSGDLPVAWPGAPGFTTPPPGWQTGGDFAGAPSGFGNGQFYETRSRPLRVEGEESGVFRLGYNLSIIAMDPDGDCRPLPIVRISETLLGGGLTGVFLDLVFADPSYGPSIRLLNTPDTQGGLYGVNLIVFSMREEDRVALA